MAGRGARIGEPACVPRLLVLAILLSTVGTTTAHADEILLLPTTGTPAREEEAARHVARLRERLVAAGFVVRDVPSSAIDRATAALACDTESCASAAIDSLATDVVCAPALWARSDGRRELSLNVQGRSGRLLELSAEVTDANTGTLEAADRIAEQLLARRSEIVSHAEPTSDDQVEGSAPEPPEEREPSAWNIVLGIGVVAVSAMPIALGATAYARRGECVSPRSDGGCEVDQNGIVEHYAFDTRSKAFLFGGIAAATAGIVILAARPIRVTPAVSVSSAALEMQLDF